MNNETNVTKVVGQVKSKEMAEQVVAELLKTFSTDTAWKTVSSEAKYTKQSPRETVRRAVSNLFTTFKTFRT